MTGAGDRHGIRVLHEFLEIDAAEGVAERRAYAGHQGQRDFAAHRGTAHAGGDRDSDQAEHRSRQFAAREFFLQPQSREQRAPQRHRRIDDRRIGGRDVQGGVTEEQKGNAAVDEADDHVLFPQPPPLAVQPDDNEIGAQGNARNEHAQFGSPENPESRREPPHEEKGSCPRSPRA